MTNYFECRHNVFVFLFQHFIEIAYMHATIVYYSLHTMCRFLFLFIFWIVSPHRSQVLVTNLSAYPECKNYDLQMKNYCSIEWYLLILSRFLIENKHFCYFNNIFLFQHMLKLKLTNNNCTFYSIHVHYVYVIVLYAFI